MKFLARPQRGGLVESMKEIWEFDNLNDLIVAYALKMRCNQSHISVELYSETPDNRIGWYKTYIILQNGHGIGFCTDSYSPNWRENYYDYISRNK